MMDKERESAELANFAKRTLKAFRESNAPPQSDEKHGVAYILLKLKEQPQQYELTTLINYLSDELERYGFLLYGALGNVFLFLSAEEVQRNEVFPTLISRIPQQIAPLMSAVYGITDVKFRNAGGMGHMLTYADIPNMAAKTARLQECEYGTFREFS